MTEETQDPQKTFFQDFVEQMGVQIEPVHNVGAWTLVNTTDEDGKKSVYAVLLISDPNGARAYYYNAEMLTSFIRSTMQTHQRLLAADQSVNPLSIANLADLKDLQNGHGPIPWPPNKN